jgi:hypothetical protein
MMGRYAGLPHRLEFSTQRLGQGDMMIKEMKNKIK